MEWQSEAVEVRVERAEEDEQPLECVTVIDAPLVALLAKIAARGDEKSGKYRPLYNLLGVFMIGLVLWMGYTYFIAKTQTSRGPVLMVLLLVMALFLFWYVNQPIERFIERRMQPFLGQQWVYTVTEEGVDLLLNGQTGHFDWDELRGWWQEDGYYLMEVSGQVIALPERAFDAQQAERLRSLLYIYLGEAEQRPGPEQT